LYNSTVKVGRVLELGSSRKVHYYEEEIVAKVPSLQVNGTEFEAEWHLIHNSEFG